MPALDSWILSVHQPGKQRVLRDKTRYVSKRMVMLVPVDLFVSQFSIQIVLVEREGEWELNVVRKFTLKLIEALHLNH